jgi:predicted permease
VLIETLWQDIRFGARTLIKNPVFTAVALATLALGIGANTTIFSLTSQVLLRDIPVDRPEQLVIFRSPGDKSGSVHGDGDPAASFSYPMYKGLRDRSDVLAGVLARYAVPLSVAGRGQTDRVSGELVSGNYFQVLGVPATLGRVLTPEDETAPGANPVAILSYGFWQRRFAGDPSILNKTLQVNGATLTVVGVAPSSFIGVQIGRAPDIFVPITMKSQMTPNWDGLNDPRDYWLSIIGRLKPGSTPLRAQTALAPQYRAILEAEALLMKLGRDAQQRLVELPLLLAPGSHGRPILQSKVKELLLILTAMVGLVLLIACVNLASLMVARAAARQREVAVRISLGACRWRLVRQLLTESCLVALIGGGIGLLLSWWVLDGLVGTLRRNMGAAGLTATPDPTVMLFALAVSASSGLLFGLVPALRATGGSLHGSLKEQGIGVSESLSNVRVRKGLMICQITVTTVLLIGAALFARSLDNLQRLDVGVQTDHVVQFSIAPELNLYSPSRTIDLADRLRHAIASMPGARSVSAAEIAILADSSSTSNITVEGYPAAPDEDTRVGKNWIGPDYFSTMGVPLHSGREFTEADAASSPKVDVVNEAFVRRFFAGRTPIGSRFTFGAGDVHPDIEIVGVVSDSKHSSVRSSIQSFIYLPYAQQKTLGHLTFYVRSEQNPLNMAAALRRTVAQQDPDLPVYNLQTLVDQVDQSIFNDRAITFLSLCFGLLAAMLAAVGLYGVMAYTVARRTREVGIRMALGASRNRILWMVLNEVIRMTALGLAVGLIAAYALGRLVESELFGVKASDPLAFVIATLLLSAVAMAAGYVPARRASSADPMKSLRYE